ncbi:hypothetical protein GCM10011396_11260 [Undibacterium terreum]|uniref:SH3 domain-containing protein n=1 Tax=Undibacterium terreum TaxID=1224302 RepID=A0A916XF55_9BURK|nr:hypothetical protein GCM10011396_11260 [Undibacterium terreum]
MRPRSITLYLAMLISPYAGATESVCAKASVKAEKEKILVPAYMSGRKVIGKGEAYFYTAPDEQCQVKNIFIIPNDVVQAYSDVENFTYVIYWNVKGKDVSGWMLSSRLVDTGTGIGPNYEQK